MIIGAITTRLLLEGPSCPPLPQWLTFQKSPFQIGLRNISLRFNFPWAYIIRDQFRWGLDWELIALNFLKKACKRVTTEWCDFPNVKFTKMLSFLFGSRGLRPDLPLPFGRKFLFCLLYKYPIFFYLCVSYSVLKYAFILVIW